MGNDISSTAKKNQFDKVQRMIDFPRIDELMSQYVIFERCYIQNALIKAILTDNQEFITFVKNQLNNPDQSSQTEFKKQDGKTKKGDSGVSSTSTDGQQNNQSVLDMVDNFSFILDKCSKRSLMSLSIANTCSMFNFINELLQEQLMKVFEIRFLIFSGLIQKQEYAQKYQGQIAGSNKLHKIAHLFELNQKCGFYKI